MTSTLVVSLHSHSLSSHRVYVLETPPEENPMIFHTKTIETYILAPDSLANSIGNNPPQPVLKKERVTAPQGCANSIEDFDPVTFHKIVATFEKVYPSHKGASATSIVSSILQSQPKIQNRVTYLRGTDLFHNNVFVFPNSFFVAERIIGEGQDRRVYSGHNFPTEHFEGLDGTQTPSKAQSKAFKEPKGFAPLDCIDREFSTYKGLNTPERKRVDGPSSIGKTQSGETVALYNLYESDLNSIDYSLYKNPASYLIKITLQLLEGLEALHKKGLAHYDIKPGNLLVGKAGAAVSDYTMREAVRDVKLRTRGTPEYLNPRSFNSLIGQRNRKGVQRQCDDMYAFALSMLQCISNLGNQLRPEHYDPITSFESNFTQRTPSNSNLKFSERELKEIDQEFPNRVIIRTHPSGKELIKIFPEMEERGEILMSDLDCGLKMSSLEIKKLKQYAKVCLTMLKASDDKRFTTDEMHSKLLSILGPSHVRPNLAANPKGKRLKKRLFPDATQVAS